MLVWHKNKPQNILGEKKNLKKMWAGGGGVLDKEFQNGIVKNFLLISNDS